MKLIEKNQTIKKEQPDFVAKVRFVTTEEGGRKGFAATGYRPTFKLLDQTEMTSAKQKFRGTDQVQPGQEVISEIRIIWVEAFEQKLSVGTDFELREGSRTVAKGEIIEVINERLRKK